MSSSEKSEINYAIDIQGLTKSFKRHTLKKNSYTTLKSSLLNIFTPKEKGEELRTEVLKNLTLRIPQGSSVGIIGKNGTGKSTLLKLITGIYKPNQGTIKTQGRIAALIELGAGFHPDFTGRENLYLAGVMYGLTRDELDERYETIVAFAELEDVIDDPVKTYSSGMYMRLGFSLAVHTDPDILLVDEVLAVGDATFVNKCKEQLAKLRKEGKTLLLVTHDLDAVSRWCDEALWIHEGEVKHRGFPKRVIDEYLHYVEEKEEKELLDVDTSESSTPSSNEQEASVDESLTTRWGSREVEVTQIELLGSDNKSSRVFQLDDKVSIQIEYLCNEDITVLKGDVVFGVAITRDDGLLVHGSNTDIADIEIEQIQKKGSIRYDISALGLVDGTYSLDVAVHRKDGYAFDYHRAPIKFAVRNQHAHVGVYAPKAQWQIGLAQDDEMTMDQDKKRPRCGL